MSCSCAFHHRSYGTNHFLLSGLINTLQGSSSFFNCSVTISDFQVKGLHQLDFLLALALSVPVCCCRHPCTWGACSSLTFLPAPVQVHIGKPFLHSGRKGFYRLPSLLAGREWLSRPCAAWKRHITYTTILSGYCLWHIFKWTPQWLQLWLKAVCSLPHWRFPV